MKNYFLYIFIFVVFNTVAFSQNLNNLFGNKANESNSSNPLGNILGGQKQGGGGNPLGGLMGGNQNESGGGILGAFGSALDTMNNANLGPVGKYMLGRKVSAMVIGRYPKLLDINDPRTAYVRNVTLTIMGASRYYGNYKEPVIIIIDDDKLINAFAAPGGFIFISTGMLNLLENEDELAFVLAHEIGHIELDHGLNAVIHKQSGDIFKQGAGSLGMNVTFMDGMIGFAENGYSKDLEMEADGRGAALASLAGYSIDAALNVIRKFENMSGKKHVGYPEDRSIAVKRVFSQKVVPQDHFNKRKIRFQKIIHGK